jgi:hypothetical protein
MQLFDSVNKALEGLWNNFKISVPS